MPVGDAVQIVGLETGLVRDVAGRSESNGRARRPVAGSRGFFVDPAAAVATPVVARRGVCSHA